jgi:hypothetical protein
MEREPHVGVPHGLVDVDKDENSREKESEQQVRPIRDSVRRIETWIKKGENNKDQPWKEQREQKKVEVDFHNSGL